MRMQAATCRSSRGVQRGRNYEGAVQVLGVLTRSKRLCQRYGSIQRGCTGALVRWLDGVRTLGLARLFVAHEGVVRVLLCVFRAVI